MQEYQKLDSLHALYIASIVASELMGSKTFPLLFLNASVAIFTLPITFSINDIIFEVYGKKRALSFVRSGLQILFFLFAFNLLAVILPPSARFQTSSDAYQLIFGKSMRIILASLTAFFVSERLDVFVFSKIKAKLADHHLWLRNNVSNLLGQLIDTILFMTLAFYQPGNIGFLISLIIPYWLLKSFSSLAMTPLVYKGVAWLKEEEKKV
ncbi:queuosine precursor transporter [Patescibacteria group bacterium]|nr:queuosine precursor transporter [Patescibacteria group bacterium]MBU1967301.1 queuosine precursor transporter [Patescibacteria group bacterium]MBU2543256.1 queuosine precursor transporter [Patescibacteria group bacterium]